MNRLPGIPNDMRKISEAINRQHDQVIKQIFRDKIKPGFLINMKYRVLNKADLTFIQNVFNLNFGPETGVVDSDNAVDYDICRHIVGTHKSNTIFMTPEERSFKEKDEEYKEQLANQVVARLRVRKLGSVFFRNKPLVLGEDYIYYSVPYELFVLCVRMGQIVSTCDQSLPNVPAISRVMNKSLAALSLIEDGFFDSAYPLCRSVIELYLKLLLVKDNETLTHEMFRFANFDLDKTCCSQEYSDEFNQLYENKKGKTKTGKVEFLQYGFVDCIPDYHQIVTFNPYSIGGIMKYLLHDACDEDAYDLERLDYLYKMCHGYTHGNVVTARFPLLHYFELSLILGIIVPNTYRMLCDICDSEYSINETAVLNEFNRDFALLNEQFKKRSTENFESNLYQK